MIIKTSGILFNVSLLIFFRLVYDIAYFLIYPSHAYHGIVLDINVSKLIISYIVLMMLGLFSMTNNRALPSKVILRVFLYGFFIPFTSYFSLANQNLNFFIWCTFFFIILALLTRNPMIIKSKKSLFMTIVPLIPVLIVLTGFLVSFSLNGVPSLTALNPLNVYQVRDSYTSSPILEYLSSALIYFSFPFLLAHSYVKKKPILFMLISSLWVLFYLTSGSRLNLVIFIISAFFLLSSKFLKHESKIPFILISGLLLSLIEMIFFNQEIFSHFSIYRSMIVPSWLTFEYFEYYSIEQTLYFAEQFPSLFNVYGAEVNSSLAVGERIFGKDAETWANVGVFGYAFANMSYFGYVELLILVVLFKVLDGCFVALESPADRMGILVFSVVYGLYLQNTNIYNLLLSRSLFFGISFFIILAIFRQSKPLFTQNGKIPSSNFFFVSNSQDK